MSNEEIDLLEGQDRAVKAVSGEPRVLVDDEPADDGVAELRQAVYDDDSYYWSGKALEPFSSSRDAMFSRIRSAMGAPSFRDVMEDTSLFIADAHVILYLCSHKPGELISQMRDMDSMVEQIIVWADENAPRERSTEATILGLAIFNGSKINQAESVPEGGINTSDELGN